MTTQALLLSSSKYQATPYLSHAIEFMRPFSLTTKKWLFIPFADASLEYDDYLAQVATGLAPLAIELTSIHQYSDYQQAIADCDVIVVGGGNTFHLLHELYRFDLLATIQAAVAAGKPYIGWSAGANIAGLSIRTTNDMPIIYPPSFESLALVPYQLNPHYSDYVQAGHNGETRAQRIEEFTRVDSNAAVIGLQEGSVLHLQGQRLSLLGCNPAYYFCGAIQHQEIAPGSALSLSN